MDHTYPVFLEKKKHVWTLSQSNSGEGPYLVPIGPYLGFIEPYLGPIELYLVPIGPYLALLGLIWP